MTRRFVAFVMKVSPQNVGYVVVALATIWSWYVCTTGPEPNTAWFLVAAVVIGMLFGLCSSYIMLKRAARRAEDNKKILEDKAKTAKAEAAEAETEAKAKAEAAAAEAEAAAAAANLARAREKKGYWFFLVVFILWIACVVMGGVRIASDKMTAENVVLVITDKAVYWLAMACAVLVLCALPSAADVYVNHGHEPASHIRVARARSVALMAVWCALDVYTLYLAHEVILTVHDYRDNAHNTTFGDRWHLSTNIPDNSTSLCDQMDAEMQTYGLLYHNQVSPHEETRFLCAFELHEAIRLNFLCALVAWTIYRISTHDENGLNLVVTALVFLALSTTVDDLRSYWVLKLEQAVFLSVAVVLDAWVRSQRKQDKDVLENGTSENQNDGFVNSVAGQTPIAILRDETTPFLMPRPGAQRGLRLEF